MKIYYWIDHTVTFDSNTGMQRLVRNLAKSLLNLNIELVFVCWDDKNKILRKATLDELNILSNWNGPKIDNFNYYDDKTIDNLDIKFDWIIIPEVTFITPHSTAPTLDIIQYAKSNQIKVSFIFYDAIPLKLDHPHYIAIRDKHSLYMQHISLADAIFPISKFSTKDLIDFYSNKLYFDKSTLPNIMSTPLAGEIISNKRVTTYKENTNDSIKILCVGSIEYRKNQIKLVEAFEKFIQKNMNLDIQLILIGNILPDLYQILEKKILKSNNKIVYYGNINEEKLNDLYKDCMFTVFPSIEEGFGLPILESLWYGKPCICANFGAMQEVALDGGCLQVDVNSSDVIYKAIDRLVFDKQLQKELSYEAISRNIKSWFKYGQNILQNLEFLNNNVSKINKIYYLIEPRRYNINSGIQRVSRSIAREFLKLGIDIDFVKWDDNTKKLISISTNEYKQFSKWNGPRADFIEETINIKINDWLFTAELIYSKPHGSLADIIEYAKNRGMLLGIIFHDNIPYKMKNIYPQEASYAHFDYMMKVSTFDVIIPNSKYTSFELKNTYFKSLDKFTNISKKIIPCVLPGEFMGTQRIIKHVNNNTKKIQILSVGTIEHRKNHVKLLEAFDLISTKYKDLDIELIIVGKAPVIELENILKRYLNKNKKIKWLDHTSDEELKNCYKECDFTIYPSIEEGFGLPILESIWNAKPCICHNAGALEEVGAAGGALLVDMYNIDKLYKGIEKLVLDTKYLATLTNEAINRKIKTWHEYSSELVDILVSKQCSNSSFIDEEEYCLVNQVEKIAQPLLSICVSTYNRANWIKYTLPVILKYTEPYRDIIEVIVCDNASGDNTQEIVSDFIEIENFYYYKNEKNVGMLGNLKVSAHHCKGKYVWLIGDDDILVEGTIEKVLRAIITNPQIDLVYLNYSYTQIDSPDIIEDYYNFVNSATPVADISEDYIGKIKDIAPNNENFFTAIYACIFRRDHALKAYSQDTTGRPFSTLLTCIPTSYYICNNMFDKIGYWIGTASVVVNMNVSWSKYASLWILERIPELYDLAEEKGSNGIEIDKWRKKYFEMSNHWIDNIYQVNEENNLKYFSMDRFIQRNKHLDIFNKDISIIKKTYEDMFYHNKDYDYDKKSFEYYIKKYNLK